MKKNRRGPFYLQSAQLDADLGPLPRAKPARYRTRASITDVRDPPISSRFPNHLPCSGRSPPPA
jgi:hypothetical protein